MMSPERIEQARLYAESLHTPNLAKRFIQELIEEVNHWKQFSDSQEEAMGMMERGTM